MRELTKEQIALVKRLPSGFWDQITLAMFRVRYLEEDEVLEASARLCNFIADEIDNIKDSCRMRFDWDIAEIAKIVSYPDEAVIEPLPTVSSYRMSRAHRGIPVERIEFCCKYLKAAALDVDNEDIVLEFKGFTATLDGDTWFAECPYCGAKLVINDNGMKTEGMGEC